MLEQAEHDTDEREVLSRLRDEYENRIDHLRHRHGAPGSPETAESRFDHQAQTEALRAERDAIMRLRDRGQIPDEISARSSTTSTWPRRGCSSRPAFAYSASSSARRVGN